MKLTLSILLPEPRPVAFTLLGFPVMWYGILIACGMLLAALLIYARAPRHRIPREKTIDFFLICIPAGIIGARLYYVIFNWSYYAGDIRKILNLREGGLAIHGGLILGMLTALILCLAWRIRPLDTLDLAVPGIALAQAVGRWGNYFNQEAYGGPTDLPWAILINGQTVHPTFLYESLWCLFLFFFLLVRDNRRRFSGQTFLLYGILYSAERFLVEGLRTDSLMLGSFRQAQVLSLSVILIFSAAYVFLSRKSSRSKGRRRG